MALNLSWALVSHQEEITVPASQKASRRSENDNLLGGQNISHGCPPLSRSININEEIQGGRDNKQVLSLRNICHVQA